MTSKSVLRKDIKSVIKLLSPQQHLLKSQRVASNLWGFINGLYEEHFKDPDSYLGLFAPLSDEVDIFGPKDHLRYPTAFPYGEEQQKFLMSFRESSFDELEESRRFGVTIRSPKKAAKVVKPQIIVVPGVGFTASGERLGRGRGYYDRYLESYAGIKIGVCFEEQLKKELPCDEHDQRMDYVVTELDVIDCKAGN